MSSQRISFHFPREAAPQLEAIKSKTILTQNSDVVRVALIFYDRFLELAEGGYKFSIVTGSGEKYSYSPYRRCAYPGFFDAAANEVVDGVSSVPRNFFFSGEVVEALESIKGRSLVSSNADAIRVALTAYKELLMVDEIGDRLLILDKAGNEAAFNPHRPWSRMSLGRPGAARMSAA